MAPRSRRLGGSAPESLVLLGTLALAGAASFTAVGHSASSAIRGAALGAAATQQRAAATVSAEAALGRWVRGAATRFGDAGGGGAEAAHKLEVLLAADAPGVTATHNSTARIAALPTTVRSRELPPKPAGALRLVSFNSASGAPDDVFRTAATRERIANVLRPADVDVVAFQEVDHVSRRSGGVNTALDAIARLDPAFSRFRTRVARGQITGGPGTRSTARLDGVREFRTANGVVLFGESTRKAVPASGPRWSPARRASAAAPYGTALYLGPRLTYVGSTLDVLPPASFDGTLPTRPPSGFAERRRLQDTVRAAYGDLEPRTALVVEARGPDGAPVTFLGTHLSLQPEHRTAQLRRLRDLALAARSRGQRVYVLGDLNAHVEEVAEVFEPAGIRRMAGLGIDQIWATPGDDLRHGADFHTEGGSDHNVAAVATVGGE